MRLAIRRLVGFYRPEKILLYPGAATNCGTFRCEIGHSHGEVMRASACSGPSRKIACEVPGSTLLNESLSRVLACPADRTPLREFDDALVCAQNHRFPIEDGVPVLTSHPRREPIPLNMPPCPARQRGGPEIDAFVNDWIVNTNGNLYWRVRGRLPRYPVPNWPFGGGEGRRMLEIGCSWGRWCIAASCADWNPIGLDVHIDALGAAKRVSKQLHADADFVCGDAHVLPFQSRSIDLVFSYSVLQHIDRAKVRCAFREIARVLKPDGRCIIQLPHTLGLLSLLQQAKRGFREARAESFEMRYWSFREIRESLREASFSRVQIHTDGFFSQNPQISDLDLLAPMGKMIALASYAGRLAADALPFLNRVADSLWIEAHPARETS